MGYGEFVGGGSVKWEITHTNGDTGSGGPHGGNGRDKDPAKNSGAVFTIVATNKNGQGTSYGPFLVDDYKIKLEWTAPVELTPSAAAKLGVKATRAKTAKRKSYKSPKK